MDPQQPTNPSKDDEDVEGHLRQIAVDGQQDDTDDVEGHRRAVALDGNDDVEGHLSGALGSKTDHER
jgi:hypothetical protein